MRTRVREERTSAARIASFRLVLDFTARQILIGGTESAGEVKTSVFSSMNFLLAQRGVLSMHEQASRRLSFGAL